MLYLGLESLKVLCDLDQVQFSNFSSTVFAHMSYSATILGFFFFFFFTPDSFFNMKNVFLP